MTLRHCNPLGRGTLFAAVVAIAVVAGPPANAGEDTRDAGVLANRAAAMFEDPSRRDEAIALYHRAVDMASGPLRAEILLNLGKAYGAVGQLPQAHAYLREAGRAGPDHAAELGPILAYLEGELADTHAPVTIETRPADASASVTVDGRRHRFRAPLEWWFPAGEHVVHVDRDGYEPADRAVTARPGVPVREFVRLRPGADAAGAADPPPEPVEPPPPIGIEGEASAPSIPAWKWALLGGGAAVALAGVGTWAAAYAEADELNGGRHEDREAFDDRWARDVAPLQTTSYVLWGVGGAATVTGLVLVLVDASDASPTTTSSSSGTLLPLVAPGTVGAAWRGSF